jgi:hypothetical protein
MRQCIKIFMAFCIFSSPIQSHAYDKASAVNVFTHEILTCVSYYTLWAGELRQSGDNMDAYKYFVTASDLLKKAKAMVPTSRLQEKLDLITAKMTAKRGDGEGEGGLYLQEYADTCRKLAASPEARLQYWMDKR